jgi:hypothetical protein
MKIKMQEIIEASEILGKIDKTSLDIKISYRLSRILDKTFSKVRDFNKAKETIFLKYGKEDEKTKKFAILPENTEIVTKEVMALLEKEIELNAWQLPLSMLEGIKLTPGEVSLIDKFILDDLIKISSPTVSIKKEEEKK